MKGVFKSPPSIHRASPAFLFNPIYPFNSYQSMSCEFGPRFFINTRESKLCFFPSIVSHSAVIPVSRIWDLELLIPPVRDKDIKLMPALCVPRRAADQFLSVGRGIDLRVLTPEGELPDAGEMDSPDVVDRADPLGCRNQRICPEDRAG